MLLAPKNGREGQPLGAAIELLDASTVVDDDEDVDGRIEQCVSSSSARDAALEQRPMECSWRVHGARRRMPYAPRTFRASQGYRAAQRR